MMMMIRRESNSIKIDHASEYEGQKLEPCQRIDFEALKKKGYRWRNKMNRNMKKKEKSIFLVIVTSSNCLYLKGISI